MLSVIIVTTITIREGLSVRTGDNARPPKDLGVDRKLVRSTRNRAAITATAPNFAGAAHLTEIGKTRG